MRKLFYLIYVLVISFVILEVSVRFLSQKNPADVELFMNKKHRYLLPLPVDKDSYNGGSLTQNRNDGYRRFDDTLGWNHIPWGSNLEDFPCFANNKGIRIGESDFIKKEPAKKKYNIVTIGNSFTHGDAVSYEDTWSYILQSNTGKQVANLGVGGYGLQQALMRFMFSGIDTDTVLFGAISGDFERAIDPVYTFYQGGNKTKPLIEFTNEGYSFINVPVLTPHEFYSSKREHTHEIFSHIRGFNEDVFSDALWTKSYFLRLLFSIQQQKISFKDRSIYLVDDKDLEHCIKIFKLFDEYCKRKGIYGKVILIDTTQNFYHKDEFELENPWQLVEEKLRENDIPFADFHHEVYAAFKEKRENVIHPIENLHYSPAGNKLLSKLIIENLFNK
jgi:hypothetical protein